MNGVELIPSADRVIQSLRALGYDLPQAIADIVDNSVAAHSTKIDIDIKVEGTSPSIIISDNGHGMSETRLREALRYGSRREYVKGDLGKFGLGLKTASLSQCQALTVASRSRTNRPSISAYKWDLGHISRTNRWEILKLKPRDLPAQVLTRLRKSCGTVVLWERLDKIHGHEHLRGALAKKRVLQLCREIDAHLGMIYHRFLTGKANCKKISIRLNGIDIQPWDPLCESERKSKQLEQRLVTYEHGGKKCVVLIEPAILPAQSEFSTLDSFKAAGGPLGWNLQQGFYFYRGGRMIQSGGWSRMRAPDEHTKLARIAVHFPSELDDAFKVNVAKMRVQLPASFRDLIEKHVTSIVIQARDRYSRKALEAKVVDAAVPKRKSGSRKAEANSVKRKSRELLTVSQWADILLSTARGKEKKTVRNVLMRLL